MRRLRFVFSDSLHGGSHLSSSWGEGRMSDDWSAADLAALLTAKYFAGIVCVAN